MSTLLYVLASAGGLVLAAFIAWTVRTVSKVVPRVMNFLDDWFGEPPREGVAARAGVMHRLAALETAWRDSGKRIQRIEREVFANGGLSMRDTVDRIEAAVSRPQVPPGDS